MDSAQVGESNPPHLGALSHQSLSLSCCERSMSSSLLPLQEELQRVFTSQREHSHPSRSCVETFPTQLLPLCHPHCLCPSLAMGRNLQGAEMMAPGGMGSLGSPGGWQAVPSPQRDAATQRGCPHSLHARPSSAREMFGRAHSQYELM